MKIAYYMDVSTYEFYKITENDLLCGNIKGIVVDWEAVKNIGLW